jgi:hypothetical protein
MVNHLGLEQLRRKLDGELLNFGARKLGKLIGHRAAWTFVFFS